jgi:hypothetical protein
MRSSHHFMENAWSAVRLDRALAILYLMLSLPPMLDGRISGFNS